MQEPTNWGAEALVNTKTDGDQTESQVVGLVGGGYVIVWSSKVAGEPYDVRAQMYDAFGNEVGSEIVVGDYMHTPDVAATADGGFIVALEGQEPGIGTYGILATVYDASGAPTSSYTLSSQLDPNNPVSHEGVRITALSDGSFAAVYYTLELDGTYSIHLQMLDSTGAKLGSQQTVGVTDDTTTIAKVDIADLGNGHFTVAWVCDEAGDRNIYMQRYLIDGTKEGTIVPVASSPDDQFDVNIAADGSGTFLVAYNDNSNLILAGNNVIGQLFQGNGLPVDPSNPVVPGFGISDPNELGPITDSLSLVGLPTGGFFAVWMETIGGSNTIAGRLLDAQGTMIGDEVVIKVPGGTPFSAYKPEVAVLADGRIVVTWQDDSDELGDTVGTGIHSRIIDPRGGDIVGTENGEVIFGSPYGNDTADTIKALGGNDTIDGYDGNDSMEGGAGNDIFQDESGADTMDGGANDDLFYVDDAGDVIKEALGGGTDKIIFQLSSDFVLAAGVEVERIELTGSDNNHLTGNEFGQFLQGSAGRNKVMGLGGNDTLDGGGANGDTLEGGEGDDVYLVNDKAEIIVEALNGGTDTVHSEFSYSLVSRANVENLTLLGNDGIEGIGNELNNKLTGNDNDNALFGFAGNDTLDGAGGADTMEGGIGDDTYHVAQSGDQVIEEIDEGTDTVASKLSYTLGDNLENLMLTGSGTLGTGNGANNKLTGNKLANTLRGLAGNDTLDGITGDDTMEGGIGNDYYFVNEFGDVVTELADEGTDTVASQIDYVLGATLENLVLINAATKGTGNAANNKLTGNALDNTLKGGAGNDTIDGGAGTDRAEGGKGNDTYVLANGHDVVVDSSGADDRITSTISRKLSDYTGIENLTLVGTAKANGTGNAAANDLIGNAAANKLNGAEGNDLLRGMNGADILTGGAGRDTFDFNTIIEIGKGAGTRDIVKDFAHGVDKLDLSTIDASTKSGNQAFTFVAAEGAGFTGVKGQLIWDQQNFAGSSKDVTIVSGDINGDQIADFQLELKGLIGLAAGDFIL